MIRPMAVAAVARVLIEGGWFEMGSAKGEDNERPLHRVWVEPFELGRWQVSNAEYARFLQSTGHAAPPFWEDPNLCHPDQPVVGVSWFDALRYCQWSDARLPTEAEWEYAARGGAVGALYPWGDAQPQSRSDYDIRWLTCPEPRSTRDPNGFGLHDMCENVHEWCADWYGADYYRLSPDRDPRGPETGERRVSRGGSWRHRIKMTRCAARSSLPPDFRYADYGFRVAMGSDLRFAVNPTKGR
jgi:formylglycine-generating enzyme required for sulfatase activity